MPCKYYPGYCAVIVPVHRYFSADDSFSNESLETGGDLNCPIDTMDRQEE